MVSSAVRILFLTVCLSLSLDTITSKSWSSLSASPSKLEEAVIDEFPEAVHKLQEVWRHFKAEFKRDYASAIEELKRFYIFAHNYISAMEHNMKYYRNETTYMLGINNLSDWTHEELRTLRGYKSSMKCNLPKNNLRFKSDILAPVPPTVDWRKKGAVTEVKDQGQCGSCWAFSTTGSVEGHSFLKNGQLPDLSEQQLVDCSSAYGNMGCNGGLMDNAFKYLKESGGSDSEVSYPYVSGKTGKENDHCLFKTKDVLAQVTGWVDIDSGNEKALQEALATKGPVSIAIDAALPSFSAYHGGVYDDPNCAGSESSLDHGVLVVGYGHEKGKDYWLVKNSWGPNWGENGYIKIRRNHHNTCGVATAASYPIV